ncbi:MAG: hypothetical protein ABIN18_21385 [Pseudomonadota bacterium]
MKSSKHSLIVLVFCALLAFAVTISMGQAVASGPAPKVISESWLVPLDKKGKVTIMGSGFQTGQELRLLFKTADGVMTNIGPRLEPKPVANERGAWATVWSYGRLVSKKLVKEGVYAILVTDTDYNILASAPLSFK